jgi:hypothetical protein
LHGRDDPSYIEQEAACVDNMSVASVPHSVNVSLGQLEEDAKQPRPLGRQKSMSLPDLGAALGGPNRCVLSCYASLWEKILDACANI